MRDAGRARLIVTLAFGLIHGFGFAQSARRTIAARPTSMELLFAFNLGVEVGQVTVVLIALFIAFLLAKVRLSMPRPIFTDIAGAFLAGEGLCFSSDGAMALLRCTRTSRPETLLCTPGPRRRRSWRRRSRIVVGIAEVDTSVSSFWYFSAWCR